MDWKSLARSLVPASLLRARQTYLAKQRRNRRAAERGKAVTYSEDAFRDLLSRLGISTGDLLLVHSSLGNFNNVVGGVAAVLRSLEATIGPNGTLMMPAFPDWLDTVTRQPEFDARITPSRSGILTELLRAQPEVRRSLHPSHSVLAKGPLADWLLADHAHSPYAFGVNSPYFRHALRGGKILMIGTNMNSMTSFHIYEDLIAPTPWLPVYRACPLKFRLKDVNGDEQSYEGYFHSLDYSGIRNVEVLRKPLVARGVFRIIETDFSYIFSLDALPMVMICLEELLAGRTAYGTVTIPDSERNNIEQLLHTLKHDASEIARCTA